jgi:hypothetical protein
VALTVALTVENAVEVGLLNAVLSLSDNAAMLRSHAAMAHSAVVQVLVPHAVPIA